MTITVSLKTPEGIVLGSDSTTTVAQPGGQIAQLFNSAQKVFEIGPVNERFVAGSDFSGAVATYNAGSFGPISWRNVFSDFYREKIRGGAGPLDVSRELLAFCQTRWSGMQQRGLVPATMPIADVGFLTATINRDEGEVFGSRIELRNATVQPLAIGEMHIGGGVEVVSRLLFGYDSGLEGVLRQAGQDVDAFKRLAAPFRAMPNFSTLPMRDAIDFVHFLVYSAIKLHRYRGGPAMIGGAIELAVVTADRGFRWVQHKPLQESIGIPRGIEFS
jgi:hypothetical protein